MQKILLLLNQANEKNEKKIHSYFFIAVEALVFFLSWYFDNDTIGMIGTLFFCLIILAYASDGGLFGSILAFAIISYPELPYFDTIPVSVYVIGIALTLSLVLMLLKKKYITKDLNISFGSIGISLGLIVMALIVSSIVNHFVRTSEFESYGWMATGLAALALLCYFLLVFTSKEGFMSDLLKIYYVMNLLILCELFAKILRGDTYIYNTGVGGKNVVSLIIEICIPFVAAIFAKNKFRLDAIAIIYLDYYFVVNSESRGGLITLFILTILLAVILSKAFDKGKKINSYEHTRNYFLAFCGIVIAVCVGYMCIDGFQQGIQNLMDRGDDLTGREDIWRDALVYAKDDWFSGGSLSALFEMFPKWYWQTDEVGIWLCHNTFVTLIASGGLFALFAYIYNIFETIYASVKTNGIMKYVFIYFLLIGFIHGMVDNTFFSPIYMIPFILIFSKKELGSIVK
jgi:hypothetical protein